MELTEQQKKQIGGMLANMGILTAEVENASAFKVREAALNLAREQLKFNRVIMGVICL